MTGFERERLTMVECQLRPNEVTDPRLLAAMRALPRERFVPAKLSGLAYMDESIEVFPAVDAAPARYLLAPMVLARLVQLATVEAGDRVLDIGCATGYSTAVLSSLGRSVVGLEPEPELAEAARDALSGLCVANGEIIEGPLARGCVELGPYDVVFINGSVPKVPDILLDQLTEGGRLVAILAAGSHQASQGKACLFVKVGKDASGLPHFDAGAHSLPGFAPEAVFSF
jgi:protein-L-isoaspartate(D-aspartate) O-methyltransferase